MAKRSSPSHAPITPFPRHLKNTRDSPKKRIIRDADIADENVWLNSPPLPKSEAIRFIEAVLALNGYLIVPGEDDNLKVINSAAQGKAPGGRPVISYPFPVPDGDKIISYILPLQNIPGDDAVDALSRIVTLNPYGSIVPIAQGSAIVITEHSTTVRTIIDLKKYVDVKPDAPGFEFIKLQRADPVDVVDKIENILEEEAPRSSSASRTTTRTPTPSSSRTRTSSSSRPTTSSSRPTTTSTTVPSGSGATIQLVADERLNGILVKAAPVDIAYVKRLINIFDGPMDREKMFLTKKLKFVSAETIFSPLQTLLTRGRENVPGTGQTTAPRTPTNNARGGNNASLTSSGGGLTERLQEPAETPPEAVVIGKTFLMSDPRTNTVIVSGPVEDVMVIDSLITKLDVRAKQVYISTVIGQLTVGENMEYGIDILHTANETNAFGESSVIAGSNGGNPARGDSFLDINTFSDVTNLPALNGLAAYGVFGDFVNVYARALEDTNRFKVISKPTIHTTNQRKGVIATGQRIAVPTSTLTDTNAATGTAVATNVDFREIVLKLEVIPLVNSEDELTLQIDQVNENIIGQQVIGGNQIPTTSLQSLKTTVTVKSGQTIVLGGLVTESDTKARSGVPLLSRIPLIKELVSRTDKDKSRQELIIFLRPGGRGRGGGFGLGTLRLTRKSSATAPALRSGRRLSRMRFPPTRLASSAKPWRPGSLFRLA